MLYQIIDEFDSILWFLTHKSLGLQRHPDYQVLSEAFKSEFKNNLDRLTDQINGPFLMGDKITVSEIVLTHCGSWAYVAKLPRENEKFNAYLKNLRSRQAYKTALTKSVG